MLFENLKNPNLQKIAITLPIPKTRLNLSVPEIFSTLAPNPDMMAVNETLGTAEDARRSDGEEVEKLEKDVKEMAEKILEYRATLPDQLRSTLASAMAAQRPVFPDGLGPAPSSAPSAEEQFKSSEGPARGEEVQEMAKKIQLLKQKFSDNLSTMPVVLNRMKDCISKIDKLDSCNEIIHPAFKRKKTS